MPKGSPTRIVSGLKRCRSCDQFYPVSHFQHHNGMIDGIKNECRECCRKYNRAREIKNGHLPYNKSKNSSWFLGVHVAERLLSNVFQNVIRMPTGNHGYDFICGKGYKVDVKSSCLHCIADYPYWNFTIKHNKVPDYFACIALDNRINLTPLHLWFVPGYIINFRQGVSITVSNGISKWLQYEQPLDKVLDVCNLLKESSGGIV